MKILVDTHILFWILTGDKKLFDRMLLAQAKAEDMLFLTRDELVLGYNEPCVIMA